MRFTKFSRLQGLAAALAVGGAAFVAGGQLAGAQDSGVTAPAPEPLCELVTKAEAEAALGHDVVVSDSGRVCSYTVADPQHFASMAVSLGPDGATADSFREGMAQYAAAANTELREVAGVGDTALATLSDQASQVIARDGDRFVTILLLGVDTPEAERVQTMSDLARTALSRLG